MSRKISEFFKTASNLTSEEGLSEENLKIKIEKDENLSRNSNFDENSVKSINIRECRVVLRDIKQEVQEINISENIKNEPEKAFEITLDPKIPSITAKKQKNTSKKKKINLLNDYGLKMQSLI